MTQSEGVHDNGKQRVLILGGYGNFGRRIAENLSQLDSIELIIAGRHLAKATQLCDKLALTSRCVLQPLVADLFSDNFCELLRSIKPALLIHTGGPFQGQDYRVPEACIAAGCHYIDLADDRRFVCDIGQLHAAAVDARVLIVSGASSVPGLSSTVIDQLTSQFSELDSIDVSIAPGNRAERGIATVRGILSYTGHPFSVWEHGENTQRHGWMSARQVDFGPTVGKRWLANVDVPDLELFPSRYSPAQTVRFQAGLELPVLHFGMVAMAWLARVGVIKNWARYTSTIFRSSELFGLFGSDTGGMRILLSGRDQAAQPLSCLWRLTAIDGIGPYIPTISAVILAKKLLASRLVQRGAMPCLGLYTLEEFDTEVQALGITHETLTTHG